CRATIQTIERLTAGLAVVAGLPKRADEKTAGPDPTFPTGLARHPVIGSAGFVLACSEASLGPLDNAALSGSAAGQHINDGPCDWRRFQHAPRRAVVRAKFENLSQELVRRHQIVGSPDRNLVGGQIIGAQPAMQGAA